MPPQLLSGLKQNMKVQCDRNSRFDHLKKGVRATGKQIKDAHRKRHIHTMNTEQVPTKNSISHSSSITTVKQPWPEQKFQASVHPDQSTGYRLLLWLKYTGTGYEEGKQNRQGAAMNDSPSGGVWNRLLVFQGQWITGCSKKRSNNRKGGYLNMLNYRMIFS